MSRRTQAEIEYDAIVYWQDRFENDLVDLSIEKRLPNALRQIAMLYAQAAIDRLGDHLTGREQTLETRP
jgi:hypothetical protein